MSPKGKQVKFQTLVNEVSIHLPGDVCRLISSQAELFVYDRDLLAPRQSSTNLSLPNEPLPEAFDPQDPPNDVADENSLQSWQMLFKDRRTWAVRLSETSDGMLNRATQVDVEIMVIRRATAVAVENVRQHITAIFSKYRDVRGWARDILKDQSMTRAGWESNMQRYSDVAIDSRLRRFFRGFEDGDEKDKALNKATLKTLAYAGDHRHSALRAQQVAEELQGRLSKMERQYEEISREGNGLVETFSRDWASLAEDIQQVASGLEEEVDVIVKKINVDYESTLGLPKTSRSLLAVTKTAMVHSQNFLPSLIETVADIDRLLRRTIERKNKAMEKALGHMQRISTVQSAIASFQPKLADLDLSEEDGASLDALSYINQIPLVYGSLLVEAVRRQEWLGKMMTDSSTLAEEMATHKDDEERRRRKWLRTVRDYLSQAAMDSKTLGIEVNVKNHEPSWPALTRDDLDLFTTSLKNVGAFDATIKDVEEAVKSLDMPSKQQMRYANAQFKNGSIHGANYSRNSLLMRGDDDLIQTLQSDKTRLEDRLKGSESRVRKLEDLLHRTSQMQRPIPSRPSSSGLDRFSTSPVLPQAVMISQKPSDTDMRRASLSSRPVSATFGATDKSLLQKIVQLEGELEAEKSKSARLQEKAVIHAKTQEDLQQKFQDETSLKKDLMDNFEAQKVEFDSERRLHHDDNRKLKIRLEETEEELDRVLGSHENARFNHENRKQAFDDEVAAIRREAAAKAEIAKQRTTSLEDKIRSQDTRISDLELDQENQQERQTEFQRALASAHDQLAGEDETPKSFENLVAAVEILSQRASDHHREIQLALDTAQEENMSVGSRLKDRSDEIMALQTRLRTEQNGANDVLRELAAEKSRFHSLNEEFDDHRQELAQLRAQFEDHATGPDALKNRLAAEEQKVEHLHLEFSSAQAAADQSEREMSSLREQIEALQSHNLATYARLQARGERAGQVSLHLFTQVDRLTRTLENIGYSVTRQDETMVIQRVPRSTAGVNSAMVDQSQSISISSPSAPPPAHYSSPPSYLHWAALEDEERETEDFEAFMHESLAFDMDAFSEAVVKRVKDVEHLARKWQREAKAYREKFQRAHLDAQQKISFRSFRAGDLALFLPTRNQTPSRPWAAFNVGAPHYFLREQEPHKLQSRDYLLARISKVEERVVDLGKGPNAPSHGDAPAPSNDGAASVDEYNPFGLSDGLRWHFLDATEDKLSAPTTPGPGKTTVASVHVDAAGSIQRSHARTADDPSGVSKTLAKSLDSRRSSANSRKSIAGGAGAALSPNATLSPNTTNIDAGAPAMATPPAESVTPAEEMPRKALPARARIPEEDVRRDQLLDP